MSALARIAAVEGGKFLIRRFIKGRKMTFCPQCGAKINIRRKVRKRIASQ